MTEQEKNEVLLKFAGFTYQLCRIPAGTYHRWITPDESYYSKNKDGSHPDLYNSLDAQAKYLWPKLTGIDTHKTWDGRFEVQVWQGHPDPWMKVTISDTLAHAIAEAVLSYIEATKVTP